METSWLASQKKAFTRWANHILNQRGITINDIDKDLKSGTVLISLIEILSGEVLSPRKMSSGSSVHIEGKIQNFTNATKALKFIEAQGINLVNCRPEHLVDNNSKMVLGLLWRIITKYHIQPSITEEDLVPETLESKSSIRMNSFMNKSTRDALLRRCKAELEPYNITPTNLTKSFQSPAAFSALVHSQKPEAIKLDEIESMDQAAAFAKVFKLAETELGIPQILDPSDLLDVSGTDECSVMTYLAYFLRKGPGTPLQQTSSQQQLQRKLPRGKSQTDVFELANRHSDSSTAEELIADNSKLREENRFLREYIKAELAKVHSSMDMNLHSTLDKFLEKYSFLDTKTHSLELSVQNLTRTSTSLASENTKLRAELATTHADSTKLRADAADARTKADKLYAEVAELQAENAKLRSDLSDLKGKASAELTRSVELTRSASQSKLAAAADVAGLQSEISNLRVEVADLQTRNGRLNVELVELKLKYEDVLHDKQDLEKENKVLEGEKGKELRGNGNDFSELRVLLGTQTMLQLKEPNGQPTHSEKDTETDTTGGDVSPATPSSAASTPSSAASTPLGHSESRVNFAENVAQEKQVPSQGSKIVTKSPSGKSTQTFHSDVTPGEPAMTPQERRKSRKLMLSGEELKLQEIVTVQSVVRQWLAKRWLRRARRRRVVAAEIINTEKTYVACLQTLLTEYFQPLRKMATEGSISNTLNDNLLKTIFNNAEVIFNINSNLVTKLESRWNTWNYYQKIGDVFLSTIEFLKCYNQYVNHYNRSLDALAECGKISAFNDFLKIKALKCGHHLRDLLIVPVQRIPRYVILLEEMARYTDTLHPDYKDLTLALSKMHRIADYVNEKKRDFEALAQVSAIQDTLVGISILEYPRLRFLMEGELLSEIGKKPKQFHVFLFNEIVLVTKLVKKVFGDRKQKQVKYKFIELIKLTPESKVTRSDCSFAIDTGPNSPTKKFTTTSEKERDNWVKNIQSSVDKIIEAKRTKAVDRV